MIKVHILVQWGSQEFGKWENSAWVRWVGGGRGLVQDEGYEMWTVWEGGGSGLEIQLTAVCGTNRNGSGMWKGRASLAIRTVTPSVGKHCWSTCLPDPAGRRAAQPWPAQTLDWNWDSEEGWEEEPRASRGPWQDVRPRPGNRRVGASGQTGRAEKGVGEQDYVRPGRVWKPRRSSGSSFPVLLTRHLFLTRQMAYCGVAPGGLNNGTLRDWLGQREWKPESWLGRGVPRELKRAMAHPAFFGSGSTGRTRRLCRGFKKGFTPRPPRLACRSWHPSKGELWSPVVGRGYGCISSDGKQIGHNVIILKSIITFLTHSFQAITSFFPFLFLLVFKKLQCSCVQWLLYSEYSQQTLTASTAVRVLPH